MPYLKEVSFQLGPVFVLFAYLVIVGSSNAVNLTDGLDGLAVLPSVMVAAGLGIMVYAAGNIEIASYLKIPYVPNVGEVVIFCGALAGAGLGFLWFNTYPAQVFMGDVGALAWAPPWAPSPWSRSRRSCSSSWAVSSCSRPSR